MRGERPNGRAIVQAVGSIEEQGRCGKVVIGKCTRRSDDERAALTRWIVVKESGQFQFVAV